MHAQCFIANPHVFEHVTHATISPTWPLQDIVLTNIVWCIAYTREVERGVVYCPKSCDSIVPGWAMQVGGGSEMMVDLCTPASK